VPALASSLADVLVAHDHPSVPLGLQHHRFDQAAVVLFDRRAFRHRTLNVVDALRELISQTLELAQREKTRTPARRDPPIESLARKHGAEEPRQLGVESRDLVEQIASGSALLRWRSGARQEHRAGWKEEGVSHYLITDISGWVASSVCVNT
jgi:hypothetical protein